MVESMLNAFFFQIIGFYFLAKEHSRKVFIFQFLLGESGEAPEMKSHVWKLRFCCLKLGESSGSSAKVLQQRAKHRARSKELLEEVAAGKCQVKCHL